MGEEQSLDDMYYIMDHYGNYYRLDSTGQLVVAADRDRAGIFQAYEVKEKVGDGKRAAFYKVVSIEGQESVELKKLKDMEESREIEEEEYDITKIDWIEYLRHFCYLTATAANYIQILNKRQSEVDLEICDILHYIELYEIREDEDTRLIELLKDARNRRREIKDTIEGVKHFQESIGNNGNLIKAQKSIKQLEAMDRRKYAPRRLPGLFDEASEAAKEKKKEVQTAKCSEQTKEHDRVIQMSEIRRDTIFDTKKMDWVQFAKYQVEFFKNAEQHIRNLELDLDDIDAEIEETLHEIENGNFNAVQGYMVFKKLKDLRTVRKEKIKELEAVCILAEPFNCDAMLEQYEDSLRAIEEIMQEPITEQNGEIKAV